MLFPTAIILQINLSDKIHDYKLNKVSILILNLLVSRIKEYYSIALN